MAAGFVQVKGVEPALTEEQGEAVLGAVSAFQQSYLGSYLTRMSDAAISTFPGGNRSLPTSAELQKFIGCALHIEHRGQHIIRGVSTVIDSKVEWSGASSCTGVQEAA